MKTAWSRAQVPVMLPDLGKVLVWASVSLPVKWKQQHWHHGIEEQIKRDVLSRLLEKHPKLSPLLLFIIKKIFGRGSNLVQSKQMINYHPLVSSATAPEHEEGQVSSLPRLSAHPLTDKELLQRGRNWIQPWERWLRCFRNWKDNVTGQFPRLFLLSKLNEAAYWLSAEGRASLMMGPSFTQTPQIVQRKELGSTFWRI